MHPIGEASEDLHHREGGEAGGAVVDVHVGVELDQVDGRDGGGAAGLVGGVEPEVLREVAHGWGAHAGGVNLIEGIQVEGHSEGGAGSLIQAVHGVPREVLRPQVAAVVPPR